jgi:hypothetical protein
LLIYVLVLGGNIGGRDSKGAVGPRVVLVVGRSVHVAMSEPLNILVIPGMFLRYSTRLEGKATGISEFSIVGAAPVYVCIKDW